MTGAVVLPPSTRAADWPMYRYDANRSAASPQELPQTMHLQWVRALPILKPAWPDQPKMQLDAVYEPIVLGKTLFVGSSRSDTLTAYDTASGSEKWRFHAEGPIRYAPAGWEGKVYFACDDGCLYCVSATSGKLVWKFRGGPSERKILGNERLISTWPARGGPVIADGKVYFAASIWPFMGIFIHCLDAETGKALWTNDGDGSVYIKQPHNADSFAGVAPQGPMVLAGDNLLVPGGRSIPAVFDRKTGKWLRYQLGENGKKGGGSQVSAEGKQFFNGGSIFQVETEKHLGAFGDLVVLTSGIGYGYAGGVLRAYDMASAKETVEESVDKKGATVKTTKWSITELAAHKLPRVETMIKAGERLYVGRPGEVQAFDLPLGNELAPSWQAQMTSTPASLVAADGRLFVVTREGEIYCFGNDQGKPISHGLTEKADLPSKTAVDRVQKILDTTKVKAGYCVVWGAGDGDFVLALAQHDLRLIVVEADADKAHKLRDRLTAGGIYTERVSVYVGDPMSFPLPPYVASLMVADEPMATDAPRGMAVVERVWNALRPYGGTAWLPMPVDNLDPDQLYQQIPPGLQVKILKDGLLLVRKGALPGAGNWTHEHGDAANTRVAKDKLAKAPLGLLWFGGPSHEGILPRHGHGPQPQVIDGRCIIEGADKLRAIDIYTGRLLWEAKLPGVGFFYNNLLHQPGANSSGGNYVCMPDGIYVVHGWNCVRLDPETGKRIGEFKLPVLAGMTKKPRWGYVNVEGDYLIGGADPLFDEKLFTDAVIAKDEKGIADDYPDKKKDDAITKLLKKLRANNDNLSSSKHLVVMDRHSGKVLWTASARSGFRHNGICVGGGRLYCIDRLSGLELAKLKRRGDDPKLPPRLLVFDLKTGELLWSTDENIFGTWLSYSAEYDIVVEAGRVARDTILDEPKGMRAYDAKKGKVLWYQPTYSGPAMIHHRTILKDQSACDLLTGAPKMRPHPLTGVPVPWEWTRNYGCNTPSASEHLMTFRSGAAGYLDLCGDGGTGNFGGFRSSCTNNLIVAGGILTAPEYTRTCSCLYQNQTSLALIHMPEAEMWTSFGALDLKGVIKHVGINLGAPGDRRDENGTLWLEFPSVGGKSPAIDIKVSGPKLQWFRRHSSTMEGPLNWVGASGVKGLTTFSIRLAKQKTNFHLYTVRLYFAEPDGLKAGQRLFDVKIQGKQMLKGFDIAKESAAPNRSLVREFKGVIAKSELIIELRPTAGTQVGAAVLSGVEIIAEDPPGKK
jgi:outer membrane protein assembly factor BamB